MRRKQPTQVLQEAMAHFEVVADYGSGDLSDQKTIDAICMRGFRQVIWPHLSS